MFGNTTTANLIAKAFYTEDQICRNDLAHGTIKSERVYVADFTKGIRTNLNLQGYYCHARTLSHTNEQLLGCDAVIIFRKTNSSKVYEYKVGLFEAKWPKASQSNNHRWDYPQKSNPSISHFNSQISRQHPYRKQAVIWEMFFLELTSGIPHLNFDIDGSSCLRHDPAYGQLTNLGSKKWTTSFLDTQFKTDCENIQHIIQDMIMCHVGTLVNDDGNGSIVLTGESSNDPAGINVPTVKIPVPFLQTFSAEDNNRIDIFLEEYGLFSYTFVDLERYEENYNESVQIDAVPKRNPIYEEDEEEETYFSSGSSSTQRFQTQ